MEVFMSLDGVGLSLVNSKPDEVAYITLSRYVFSSVACYRSLGIQSFSNSLSCSFDLVRGLVR